MDGFPGLGTLINVGAIVVGSTVGMAVGHRMREATRTVITDGLGLITLLLAASMCVSIADPALVAAVGPGVPVLVVLGAILIGGLTGSVLRIEQGLEGAAAQLQAWAFRRRVGGPGDAHVARERFVEGWLTASLVFCVGPLAILGSLSDGMGNGFEQLALKSVLDAFAALAFAATFGFGVVLSAASVAVVQGGLTLVGVLLGSVVPDAHIAALTVTGGLLLGGIGLRLLNIRNIAVGDMLPALVVAPLLTQAVVLLR
ncbi:DUF554 domain-containing protein [Georgenia yuyongxinii]|uniref:DUF554 domain-containing protein n=1 Tax=Georgenia yuyongxinii TaxID=2589797 RepID=A0A552WPZ4_9MICO|nr:DUF554 family protein [Georgenia yuyongxinii]TRW44679.1 DUF554 domain-containing protein [Georgenia yuyongxinii]